MSDLVFARNCSIARMLPGELELHGVGMNRSARGGKKRKSDIADIALYKKTLPFTFYIWHYSSWYFNRQESVHRGISNNRNYANHNSEEHIKVCLLTTAM